MKAEKKRPAKQLRKWTCASLVMVLFLTVVFPLSTLSAFAADAEPVAGEGVSDGFLASASDGGTLDASGDFAGMLADGALGELAEGASGLPTDGTSGGLAESASGLPAEGAGIDDASTESAGKIDEDEPAPEELLGAPGTVAMGVLDGEVESAFVSTEPASVSSVAVTALAESAGFTYTISSGEAYITDFDTTSGTSVQVPEQLGGLPVVMVTISNKGLTELDVSAATSLEYLDCSYNQLTELNVSALSLSYFYCNDNQLAELDVSGHTSLSNLDCSGNQLTELDVSGAANLITLVCSNNQLTDLDVNGTVSLSILLCAGNQLAELDVSGNTALTMLDCSYNQLTELDVSSNTVLTNLDCSGNQLAELDVSSNVLLVLLFCQENKLTELDVSSNMALTGLLCYSNRINGDDVDTLISRFSDNPLIARQYHKLTVIGGSGVSDTNLPEADGWYLQNSPVRVTANAAPSGKVFDRWVSSGGTFLDNVSQASAVFIMPANAVTVTATYKDAADSPPLVAPPSVPADIDVGSVASPLFSGRESEVSVRLSDAGAVSASVSLRISGDSAANSAFSNALGDAYEYYAFDMGLYLRGTDTKATLQNGGTVTVTLPVPDALLPVKESVVVAHVRDDGTVEDMHAVLKEIGGKWCLEFVADSFSPYAFVVLKPGQSLTGGGSPALSGTNSVGPSGSFYVAARTVGESGPTEQTTPRTGDGFATAPWMATAVCALILMVLGMFTLRRRARQ
jgi:hypothetical protein